MFAYENSFIEYMQFIYLKSRQSFFHRFPQIKTAKFSIKELKKIVKFRSSHLCSPIVKYFERFPNLLHKREEDEIMSFGSIQSNNFCLHSGMVKKSPILNGPPKLLQIPAFRPFKNKTQQGWFWKNVLMPMMALNSFKRLKMVKLFTIFTKIIAWRQTIPI